MTQSPDSHSPIHYNPLSLVVQLVLHPTQCETVQPTAGQLVQKDPVWDNAENLTKIQKKYIHHLPFIHYESDLIMEGYQIS